MSVPTTLPDTTQRDATPTRPLTIRYIHAGSSRHGVTRFGLQLAEAVRATGHAVVLDDRVDPGDVALDIDEPGGRGGRRTITHLQFSDSLWGADVVVAADALRATTRHTRGPVVLTLHDLPDPQDPPDRWQRRAQAYAEVARSAAAVVVSSADEAARLRLAAPDVTATVIPNPVPSLASTSGLPPSVQVQTDALAPTFPPVVGVLGWVFPGKGHVEVLQAVAGRDDLQVLAMGAVVREHLSDAGDLLRLARRTGVRFAISGWLTDEQQLRLMQRIAVPVAPQPRPSASGSMLAWIAAGRRPLVCRSPYAEELAERAPGSLTLYDPPDLAPSVEEALTRAGDPPPPVPEELHAETAALRHLHLYRQLS